MSKRTITTLAALALTLLISLAAFVRAQDTPLQSAPALSVQAQTAQAGGSPRCAIAKVNIKPNRIKPGDEVEARVAINSCADQNQVVSVRYTLIDPCGNSTSIGQSSVRLKMRGARPTSVTFQGPSPSDCPGDYKLLAEVRSKGAVIASGSATFPVVVR